MKRLSIFVLLTALFAATMSHAQAPSCPPNTPPASNCEDACVYCSLDGVSGVNNGIPTSFNDYCAIAIHNSVYYGFVAGTSSIYFSIPNWNCQTGDGIQAAIFAGCGEVLACNQGYAGAGGVTLEIGSDGFVPGSTYFLMIDGWIFDQCNFTINLVSGSTSANLPSTPEAPNGPSVVCPGAQATYSVTPVPAASYYRWTAPVGASINGQGNNVVINREDGGHEVTIDFSTAGGQVCVAVGNSCAPQSGFACKPVSNLPQQITILPTITIPLSQTPYTWEMNGQVYTQPGVYQASNTFETSSGCDSVVRQELIIQPASSGFTSGIVFWDTDEDGVFDANELVYPGGAVVATAAGLFTNSDANGYYEFPNLSQGDTIRVTPPAPGLTVKPAFRVKQNTSSTGYDFGLSPAPVTYDLKINLNTSIFRPGFSANVFVVCSNAGPAAVQDVEASVELPLDQLDLVNITPVSADVTIVGNMLRWRISALAPGESVTLKIKVGVSAQTMIGTDYTLDAGVLPIGGDYFPPNNFDHRKVTVQGAYDPNDKQAIPTVITPALIANGQAIEYTIRFQNTGTLPADLVRIVDVLESDLDPASFRLLASSHPCTWNISGNGLLEFVFDMINLPDSTSDEGGSHGFVRFSIRPRQGLMSGATLENYCDIYFDFNSAIRTNTAITKVAFKTLGSGLHFEDALIVRPNPAAYHAFCEWDTPAPEDGLITLYDLTGQRRLEIPVSMGSTQLPLDIQFLTPGLYFVILEAGNLILANKLLVAHPGPLGE